MRSLLHFIKYNNVFPLLLLGVLVVAGAVMAATGEIPSPLSKPSNLLAPKTIPVTDVSLLLQQDLSRYRMKVRIKNITENTSTYQVQYSFNTLDIVDGKWQETQKEKTLIVQKEILGKRALVDYLAEQIGQVTQQEIAYLIEVQSKVFGADRQKETPAKFANLVGQELALERSTAAGKGSSAGSQPKNEKTDLTETSSPKKVTPSTVPGVSEQELRQLIVQAVADFLAIDTTMPPSLIETETTVPKETDEEGEISNSEVNEAETPSETEAGEVLNPTEGDTNTEETLPE